MLDEYSLLHWYGLKGPVGYPNLKIAGFDGRSVRIGVKYACPSVVVQARQAVEIINRLMLGIVYLDEFASAGKDGVECDIVITEGENGTWPFTQWLGADGKPTGRDFSSWIVAGLALNHALDGWIDNPNDTLIHSDVWLKRTTPNFWPGNIDTAGVQLIVHELLHTFGMLKDLQGDAHDSIMDYDDYYTIKIASNRPTAFDLHNVGLILGFTSFYQPVEEALAGLPDGSTVYWKDNETDSWTKWTKGAPPYANSLSSLIPFSAYDISVPSDCILGVGPFRIQLLTSRVNRVGWPLA